MKGGGAYRLRSADVTGPTAGGAPARTAAMSFSASTPEPTLKSLPLILKSRVVNSRPSAVRKTSANTQYSSGWKALIARSRSTTSRSATDWTRPALEPFSIRDQSSGLTW